MYTQAFTSLIINAWSLPLNSILLPKGYVVFQFLLSTSLHLFAIPETLEDAWHINLLASMKIKQSPFKIHFISAIDKLFFKGWLLKAMVLLAFYSFEFCEENLYPID